LEIRLQEAAGHQLGYSEFLELVLQDELLVRNDRLIQRRVKSAQFREVKVLDEFDWSFNPSIHKKQIFDLASCRFLREARDVLFLGPPGVGKSFLVQAIAYQAIKSGFVVLYRSIFDLVRDFLHDEALDGQEKVLARYLKPDLLVIDDMGMKQLPHCHVSLLIHRARSRFTTAIIRTTAKSWK
jgi:DNA replication protein DnaC